MGTEVQMGMRKEFCRWMVVLDANNVNTPNATQLHT